MFMIVINVSEWGRGQKGVIRKLLPGVGVVSGDL